MFPRQVTRLPANSPKFAIILALFSLVFTACGLVGASNGATPPPEGTPAPTLTATPGGTAIPTVTPTPTATPRPTATPALAPTLPSSEAREGEGPVVAVTPIPATLPTYWHPGRVYSIAYPDRWEVTGPTYDSAGLETVAFKHPAESAALTVTRQPLAGCDYQTSQAWATALQNFIRDTRPDMSLLSSRAATVAALPAAEFTYKTGAGDNTRQEINVLLVAGRDAYRIQGGAALERWSAFQGLLNQLAYSFAPGPAADTTPVPPKPDDAKLALTAEETLHLLGGSTLFQGKALNQDAYWWAEDIRITLNLLDASGKKLWNATVSPSTDKLNPGGSTVYEVHVPADVPTWETSQITWKWNWSCS